MAKPNEKILVVDDDLDSLDLIGKQVLGASGYQVAMATDGGSAVQQAVTAQPDIVIVSMSLHGFSGKDFLSALKSQNFEQPVVVIVPHGGEQQALAAFRLGARDYLVRPVREAEVITVVDKLSAEIRLKKERGQLQQKVNQSAAELQERVKELDTLHKLGKAVTNLNDVGLLFNRLVETAMQMTGAEMAWMLLADEASKQTILFAAKNLPPTIQLRQPWDDGLASLVMLSAEPLNISGAGMSQFKIAQIAKAALVMPIKARDQVVGVLTVANKSAKAFSDNHQSLLSAITDYASIAVVNVRLFQALEHRARQMQQAYDELKAAKSKDEVVLAFGHQLRLPLDQAKGYIALAVQEGGTALNERLRDHFRLAAERITTAMQMIDSLGK
ncbi:MAG: response regulator [Chloroflexi bacterium]|nr:response regulator [Chloroflexota bacterium]MBI5348811.1 response regulator [Chloroflexota bacterium]